MRIVSGFKKGLKLFGIVNHATRPTTDKIKAALFNIIQFKIKDSVFLDLFSGSGQIGLEALSRGCKEVIFVEDDLEAIKVIKKNISLFDLESQNKISVAKMKCLDFVKSYRGYADIAFLDPPYDRGMVKEILPILSKKMSNHGIIICETLTKECLEESVENFCIHKIYKYGNKKLTVCVRKS